MSNKTEPLHPETVRTLQQLVHLHGADAIMSEVVRIVKQQAANPIAFIGGHTQERKP